MVRDLSIRGLRWSLLVPLLGMAALALALARPAPASAHCDSTSGPVVGAAQAALETGDVARVLPYVQPSAEPELTAAFQHTLEVRRLGGEAQQLADRYFWETAVRLHRTGEGAAYTGLREQTDFGPALEAADRALETGSLDGVYSVLDGSIRAGVAEKFEAVQIARLHAAQRGTVEADRQRAEAELLFEKYVYAVDQAATGAVVGEGAAQTAHAHAE